MLQFIPAFSISLLALGTQHSGDADGDGKEELAIGAPFENIESRGADDAGVVHILYGASTGLTASGNQLWSQDSSGVTGTPEDGDNFGHALAWGDFNGDGYDDLAIGAPGENTLAGAVHVLYGSSDGLTATGSDLWMQGSGGLLGSAESWDLFGYALAAGDVNEDGYQDLVIGVPGQDVSGFEDAGAVHVILGSSGGLDDFGNWIYNLDSPLVEGSPDDYQQFGYCLAMGDFDANGQMDVAVGVPGYTVGGDADAGAVSVLMFGSGDLWPLWTQDRGTVLDSAEPGDQFGLALAVGDFNSDGYPDLAVGVPREDYGGDVDAGAVHAIFGSADGLSDAGNEFWTQDSYGISDSTEAGDLFGYALASGQFDYDAYFDLAVGVPNEDYAGFADAGVVHIINGDSGGLTSAGAQFWHQNSSGIVDSVEAGDKFGGALVTGQFDGGAGYADLAIGVYGETVGGDAGAGGVHVLMGSSLSGLTATGDKLWTQDTTGVLGSSEPGDYFGYSLPK
ncbi:MAG: hypothetical protein EYC70_05895 [Planctomycetota bacterium]|nr:MAG: hypothetical protein EYC70_05895 [Planctomycetota bacterium]